MRSVLNLSVRSSCVHRLQSNTVVLGGLMLPSEVTPSTTVWARVLTWINGARIGELTMCSTSGVPCEEKCVASAHEFDFFVADGMYG